MTEEQRERTRERNREYQRERWARMTEEQRERPRERARERMRENVKVERELTEGRKFLQALKLASVIGQETTNESERHEDNEV